VATRRASMAMISGSIVSALHSGAAHIAFGTGDVLGLRDLHTFAAQCPTLHNRCVRFVAAVADRLTQHSLPGGCYPLPGPDFHRLDQTSLSWRTPRFVMASSVRARSERTLC